MLHVLESLIKGKFCCVKYLHKKIFLKFENVLICIVNNYSKIFNF